MIQTCKNKSVLFRYSLCTVTLIRSPGRTDITLSTKYLRYCRRADVHNQYLTRPVFKWFISADSGHPNTGPFKNWTYLSIFNGTLA